MLSVCFWFETMLVSEEPAYIYKIHIRKLQVKGLKEVDSKTKEAS